MPRLASPLAVYSEFTWVAEALTMAMAFLVELVLKAGMVGDAEGIMMLQEVQVVAMEQAMSDQ